MLLVCSVFTRLCQMNSFSSHILVYLVLMYDVEEIYGGQFHILLFFPQYEILFTVVVMMFIKYVAHSIDLQSENPWDNKALYLLYAELIMGR